MSSNTSSTTDTSGWNDDRWRLDRALADAMRVVWDILIALAVADRLAMIAKCRSILDALEAQTIAEQLEAGTPTRKVEDLLHRSNKGKASKATVKKATKRGSVIRENPKLAKKVAEGSLSGEQVDALATASEKTGGEAAHDEELIEEIGNSTPEQAKKAAEKYVNDRLNQDDIDTAYAKARKKRKVTRWSNPDRGTDSLLIEGPALDIDHIETSIDTIADHFYRQDGGRNTPSNKHRRTRDQRRFDAAATLLTGHETPGARPDDTANTHGAPCGCEPPATAVEAPDDATGLGNTNPAARPADQPAQKTKKPKKPKPQLRNTWKTSVVITATLDQALGNDPTPLTLADATALPSTVVERLCCEAEFIGMIFGADGQPLWEGRAVRDATHAQRLALIVRDGGCVLCRAPIGTCEVHHLIPWTSRMLGKTDVDNMALVCQDCHHHIHDNKLTLYQHLDDGVWKLRDAHPNEIAPTGKPTRNRNTAESGRRGRTHPHPNNTRNLVQRQ